MENFCRKKKKRRWRAGGDSAKSDVQLSRHDLSQLDEASLLGLGEERLRTLSVKLLADLKAAHARLEQSSRNSSRPPSSEAPWGDGKAEEAGTKAADRNEAESSPDHTEDEDGQTEPTPGKGGEQEAAESSSAQPRRRAGLRWFNANGHLS